MLIKHRFSQNKHYLINKIEQDIQQHIIKNKDYFERLGEFLINNPEAAINTYRNTTIEQINSKAISGEQLKLATEAFDYPKFFVFRMNKNLRVYTLTGESAFYSYKVMIKYVKDPENSEYPQTASCDKNSRIVYCQISNANSFDIFYELHHQHGIFLISDWFLRNFWLTEVP